MTQIQQGPPREPLRLPPSIEPLAVVAGFGSVGVSGFALMAAGPRVLGVEGYSALALTWTVVAVVGVGIATPGEQVITRGVAAASGSGTVRAASLRLVLVLVAALLLLPLLKTDSAHGSQRSVWLATIVVSAACWMVLAVVRGVLAGRQFFGAYAATLMLETAARLVLVLAAVAMPDYGLQLLALAVAAPLGLSALVGWYWVRRDPVLREPAQLTDSRVEQLSMTSVAMLMQVCLSTAPLWISAQSPDAALAGALVSATSYMRAPMMIAGGLYAPLLAAAAKAYVDADRRAVVADTRKTLVLGAGGTAVMVAVLFAGVDLAMTILYGGPTGLPSQAYAWLGAATVAAVVSSILTQTLYACQSAPIAGMLWVAPAAVTTLMFAMAHGDPVAISRGTALGQLSAAALLALALPYVLPKRSATPRHGH